MTPGPDDLWFLPLGGTGEIGMNLNLYGHNGRWLMVDCGITFGDRGDNHPYVQMPDPAFISDQAHLLDALVLTHAHEDHVGAVAHLWPRLRCPVYATPFTAAILRRKLEEHGLVEQVPVIVVGCTERVQIGAFDVEWLPITHSIPEAHGLMLRTPVATVLHTGDWKLDANPVLGPPVDGDRFRRLGDAGIDAMVCDSTNALTEGHSRSESDLYSGLLDTVMAAKGRVIVTTFGSNVARLHTLAAVAAATGRHMAVVGRSLVNMVGAARSTGLWQPAATMVEAEELSWLPRKSVLAVATGSQGDKGAALDRLSRHSHPDLDLEAGDTVIFSSRVIPGNELDLKRIIRRLTKMGVTVVTDDDAMIHASGHPPRDELRQMYAWVRPGLAVPTHGEPPHLQAHGELAQSCGINRSLVGLNGDLYLLAPEPGIRRGAVTIGRLGVAERQLQVVPVPDYAAMAKVIHPNPGL